MADSLAPKNLLGDDTTDLAENSTLERGSGEQSAQSAT